MAGAPIKAVIAMADSLLFARGRQKPRISPFGKFCETVENNDDEAE